MLADLRALKCDWRSSPGCGRVVTSSLELALVHARSTSQGAVVPPHGAAPVEHVGIALAVGSAGCSIAKRLPADPSGRRHYPIFFFVRAKSLR